MAKVYNILVAEDNVAQGTLYELALTSDGHTVMIVPDGAEALKYLKENTPDLIILDVNMPKLSGIDVCGRIRRVKRLKDVPVIMLTSLEDAKTQKLAQLVEVDAFVNKPLVSGKLRRMVRELVEEGGRNLPGPNAPLAQRFIDE